MKPILTLLPTLLLAPLAMASTVGMSVQATDGSWKKMPSIPDEQGFAGSFAGVSGGALLVAGGANFSGDVKTWSEEVFILESPEAVWRVAGKLPGPLGYGVSVTYGDALLCIGGSDATQHHRKVLCLRWRRGALEKSELAPLPRALANACGAVVGDELYIAGGLHAPDATNAASVFWVLDLSKPGAAWRELESWPGPARMMATAGTFDGSFFLFGGAGLKTGADGKPERLWFRDGYRFKPGAGWSRIADLPRSVVASPSPAFAASPGHLWILGGDDGTQLAVPPEEHKGFPKDILVYDAHADRWSMAGEVPFSLVTTAAVLWDGNLVIPGGEQRPRIRSNEVWRGTFSSASRKDGTR